MSTKIEIPAVAALADRILAIVHEIAPRRPTFGELDARFGESAKGGQQLYFEHPNVVLWHKMNHEYRAAMAWLLNNRRLYAHACSPAAYCKYDVPDLPLAEGWRPHNSPHWQATKLSLQKPAAQRRADRIWASFDALFGPRPCAPSTTT